MTGTEIKLRLALIRLLWDSVADDATCTCCPGDTCPQCEAMRALGAGRWQSAKKAQRELIAQNRELKRPARGRKAAS